MYSDLEEQWVAPRLYLLVMLEATLHHKKYSRTRLCKQEQTQICESRRGKDHKTSDVHEDHETIREHWLHGKLPSQGSRHWRVFQYQTVTPE